MPLSIAGLVLAIVALVKTQEDPETRENGHATAALLISGVVLALETVVFVTIGGLSGIVRLIGL